MKPFEEIKIEYNKIFNGLNGYGVSLLEKQQKINDFYIKDLIYGETPIELLYALFQLDFIKDYMNNGKVFCDIGSGIGNTVIGSYLIGNFTKCIGIELLDSLYNISNLAKEKLLLIDNKAKNIVNFIHDNALNVDFSDSDIVLFCCPNKNENLRYEIEEKFLNLKSGSLIISLIHLFKNKDFFDLLAAKIVKSAWGEAPMMFYIKK